MVGLGEKFKKLTGQTPADLLQFASGAFAAVSVAAMLAGLLKLSPVIIERLSRSATPQGTDIPAFECACAQYRPSSRGGGSDSPTGPTRR